MYPRLSSSKTFSPLYPYNVLMLIKTLTPTHVGIGRGGVYVDMPVQRDEFGFPTIWSSSLKGALKSWLRSFFETNNKLDHWKALFGREPGEDLESSSAISILDARLFLIPVRTLTGIWAYATSPHLLQQINELLKASIGGEMKNLNNILGIDKALVSKRDLITNNKILVNEQEILAEYNEKILEIVKFKGFPGDIYESIKNKGLIILPDTSNASLNILNRSMIIQYRVRLIRDTKTVQTGALWSEEYVPANTVFASIVKIKAETTIKKGQESELKLKGEVLKDEFVEALSRINGVIYVGGKETIGRGLLKIYLIG